MKKRIAIYLNEADQKLMEEVDEIVKRDYTNRSSFTKRAWLVYLKFLKRRTY
jgi:metal-responsive CopG/Arc/MetJ family transcriptional regulator